MKSPEPQTAGYIYTFCLNIICSISIVFVVVVSFLFFHEKANQVSEVTGSAIPTLTSIVLYLSISRLRVSRSYISLYDHLVVNMHMFTELFFCLFVCFYHYGPDTLF